MMIKSEKESILEPYLCEFIEQYTEYLGKFDPVGLPPKVTRPIIDQINDLTRIEFLKPFIPRLIELSSTLDKSVSQIEKFLEGDHTSSNTRENIYIPLLECDTWKETNFTYGVLDTITIKIERNISEDKFIVVPSEKEMETRIRSQIPSSWTAAINYVKKIKRNISPYHTIIINFDKRSGAYRGDSLGIALAVCFIKELLKFYDSITQLSFNYPIALTGGLNEDGQIFPVSKDTIVRKLECVFYSGVTKFVVHKDDEPFAQVKLCELQNEFPARKLQLIGVESLYDILNRKDLIEIKRKRAVKRVVKYLYSPVTTVLLILLVFIIIFTFKGKSTINPISLENEPHLLKVKNEEGEVLWTKKTDLISNQIANKELVNLKMRIIDIDNDGTNEVLICDEVINSAAANEAQKIICFKSSGEKIWEYEFTDTVSTPVMKFDPNFRTHFIDTITLNGNKLIYFFATHIPLYASAVFCLDAKTGKRINDVLWHAGHLQAGRIKDFNGDGEPELIMTAINNGLERSVIFSIDLNKLSGCAPSTSIYKFMASKTAQFNAYVLLPKTDYNQYLKQRFNAPSTGTLNLSKTGELFFQLSENLNLMEDAFTIYTKGILNEFEVDISDELIVRRDSLVSKGHLQLPYTNTSEYIKILKEQIRYWDGENFTEKR
jgi:hypothetical protein